MSDFDAEAMPVQRTIAAAAAAPIAGARVASPFAMAGQYLAGRATSAAEESRPSAEKPAAKASNRGASDLPERLLATLASCGPLSVSQIAEALGVDYAKASRLAANCVTRGMVARVKQGVEANGGSTYARVGAEPDAPKSKSGFKRWLEKKGEASAEGGAKRAKKSAPVPATVAPERPPAPPADASPALRYALFNDGALRLEAGDAALILPPAQAHELLTYLQRVSAALSPN